MDDKKRKKQYDLMQRILENAKVTKTGAKATAEETLRQSVKEILEKQRAKKLAESQPFLNTRITEDGRILREHIRDEARMMRPDMNIDIEKLLATKNAQQDAVLKVALTSGSSTDVVRKAQNDILGITESAPIRLSTKEITENTKAVIRDLTSEGKSMSQIKSMFSYDSEMQKTFARADTDMKMNSKGMYARDAIKEDIRSNWKGMILKATDVKKTKKQTTTFGWDYKWVNATFTNIETGERLKLKGNVPFIKQNVVYHLDIYHEIDDQWGPQWLITRGRCKVLPPYHDTDLLVKCVAMCATKDMSEANEAGIKHEHRKVAKEISKQSCTEDPNWTEWLRNSAWYKLVVAAGLELEYSSDGFSHQMFPLIERAYNGRSVFNNNKWWNKLSEQQKTVWEKQLTDPESAFKMCMRQSMPEELKFQFSGEFDSLEDSPFLEEDEDEDGAKKKKSKGGTYVLTANEFKQDRDPMCDLMLELNHFDHLMNMERNHKPPAPMFYLPELSLAGYKYLCKYHNWIETELSPEALTESRLHKAGRVYVAPKLVLELKDYLIAIETYNYIKRFLDQDDCKECGMLFNCIPERLQPGVEMLRKFQVIETHEFECCKTHHNKYHHVCNGEEKHVFIFHYLWAQCKKALVRRFKNFSMRKCPAHNLHKLPEVDLERFNEKQREVIVNAQKYVVSCLKGGAGCGKTEVIKLIDKAFPGCVILGFTGRSVDEALLRVENAESATIHSWKLRKNIRDRPHRILVLDEMSMISERLFMQLFALVQYDRVIFVGDPMQMQSFSDWKGVIFREMLEIFPSVELTENFRMKRDPNNKILPNCQKIREGDHRLRFDAGSFRFDTRPLEIRLQELIQEHVATGFRNIVFLCGTNPIVHSVNYKCVKVLHAGKYPFHFPAEMDETKVMKPSTFFQNTFVIGDGIMFTKPVRRDAEKDEMDLYWNRKYYEGEKEKQWGRQHKNLFRNRQQDYVKKIYRILNYNKLKQFYLARCKSIETEEEEDVMDEIRSICNKRKWTTEAKPNKKKKSSADDDEDGRTDDARTLEFPAGCVEELQYVTRSNHQGPEFRPSQPDHIWAALSEKEKDKERFFQNNNILVIGESGKWFRLSDTFQHSFASTVSSYQGAERKIVAFYNPEFEGFMEKTFGRKFLYTAVSRAMEVFYYLGNKPQDMRTMIENNQEHICCLSHFFRMADFEVREQPIRTSTEAEMDAYSEYKLLNSVDVEMESDHEIDADAEEETDVEADPIRDHECREKHLLKCHHSETSCPEICPLDEWPSKTGYLCKAHNVDQLSPRKQKMLDLSRKNVEELRTITDPDLKRKRMKEHAVEMLSLLKAPI